MEDLSQSSLRLLFMPCLSNRPVKILSSTPWYPPSRSAVLFTLYMCYILWPEYLHSLSHMTTSYSSLREISHHLLCLAFCASFLPCPVSYRQLYMILSDSETLYMFKYSLPSPWWILSACTCQFLRLKDSLEWCYIICVPGPNMIFLEHTLRCLSEYMGEQ